MRPRSSGSRSAADAGACSSAVGAGGVPPAVEAGGRTSAVDAVARSRRRAGASARSAARSIAIAQATSCEAKAW